MYTCLKNTKIKLALTFMALGMKIGIKKEKLFKIIILGKTFFTIELNQFFTRKSEQKVF